MECPVCSNTYPLSKIEEHVDECLSSKNRDENVEGKQTKRSYPFANVAQDVSNKKQKINASSTVKSVATVNAVKTIRAVNNDSSVETDHGVKSVITVNAVNAVKTVKTVNSVNSDEEPSNIAKKMEKKSISNFEPATAKKRRDNVPLTEQLRPSSLEAYVGQKKLLGPDTVLGKLLRNGQVTSMILWGPPGCGKTSLANVIAKSVKRDHQGLTRFVKLCAASSGIADIREVVGSATKELKLGRRTILFMDEIHRFNKLQQDIFLPHLEAGAFVLIGATTENPSFSLNSALLSRCRVFALERLSDAETMTIVEEGIGALNGKLVESCRSYDRDLEASPLRNFPNDDPEFLVERDAARWLVDSCAGDARAALRGLEIAAKAIKVDDGGNIRKLSLADLKSGLERTHSSIDGKSDFKHELVSAMHKSVRAGDSNAALYWLARLMAAGEDPVYIARRMVRIASEDIGVADHRALDIAVHAMHACQMIGMPECDVMLGQCAVYMSRAPKSRSVDDALRKAQKTVVEQRGPQPSVPLHIRCRGGEGKLQAALGAGRNLLLRKKEEGRNRLPAGLENLNFFD